MILLYEEKAKDSNRNKMIYDAVKRYLLYVENIGDSDIDEYDIDKFYELTKHPLKYNLNKIEIYIIPTFRDLHPEKESAGINFDISYSYVAVLDNFIRNKIKAKNIFYFGINVENNKLINNSYYESFTNRIEKEPVNSVLIKATKLCESSQKDLGFSFIH